jgi:uncharacterized RDD family membrane protein YckC
MRAAALAIDVVLMACLTIAIGAAAIVLFPDAEDFSRSIERAFQSLALSALFLYTVTEAIWGASPGKLVLGLRIARSDGEAADPWTLLLRWMTKYGLWLLLNLIWVWTDNSGFRLFAGLIPGIVALGCLRAASEDRIAWHDQWAGTAVFRKKDVLPAQSPTLAHVPPPT